MEKDKRNLEETHMLDYSHEKIQELVAQRRWNGLDAFHRIKSIYNYARDEILFGYNTDDSIPASAVPAGGYGQCNAKGTLFLAPICNPESIFFVYWDEVALRESVEGYLTERTGSIPAALSVKRTDGRNYEEKQGGMESHPQGKVQGIKTDPG